MHCRAYALPFRRLARGFAFRPHKLDYFPIMRPLKQRCGPLAWGLAIALLFGAVATPATGRVVAVVIDDSASMNSGSRWPFTVHLLQLTAAVLNEHEDRLFVRRLSEHISEKSDLRQDVLLAGMARQYAIEGFAGWDARSGTPYFAVEQAISDLIRETKAGEEAVLLILTDGGFSTGTFPGSSTHSSLAELIEHFEGRRRQFHGSNLQVTFVAVAPSRSELAMIEQQQLRAALLIAFNQNPYDGDIRIDSIKPQEAYRQAVEVLARVLGSNAQADKFYRIEEAAVALSPPPGSSEIVLIVPGHAAWPPPSISPAPLQAGQPLQYDAGMGGLLRARVTHWPIERAPAAEAPLIVKFEASLPHPDRAFVLIRRPLQLEVELWVDNHRIEPNPATGAYLLSGDEPVELRVYLADVRLGIARRSEMATAPDRPDFRVDYRFHGSARCQSSRFLGTPDGHYVTRTLLLDKPGEHFLSIKASHIGLFELRAADLRIFVW